MSDADRCFGSTLVALAVLAVPLGAQTAPADGGARFASEWPFHTGETARYDVSFGPVKVGEAHLRIEAIDSIRDTPAYRLSFELKGGPFFYKIDDRTVSWLAVEPYRSLRFEQILKEGGYDRHRRYELDHETNTFTREDWDDGLGAYRAHETQVDEPMPAGALDEISFLYLIRTLPLEVGLTYRFENYFEESGNPVVVRVLREEEVRVRAGTFDTIVVQPIIQSSGLFGEGGQGEVYLTNDDRRLIVQLKTKMGVGEVNMYLRDFDLGG